MVGAPDVRVAVRFFVTVLTASILLLFNPSTLLARTFTVSWDLTDDTVAGYVLSYGTSPGNYGVSFDVGARTSRAIELIPGYTYYFVVAAYDTNGKMGLASAEVSVVVPNNRPSLSSPGDQVSSSSDEVSLQLLGSDPDGDRLTYLAVGLPASLTIDQSTGLISGSVKGVCGMYRVSAIVSDGRQSSRQTFTWWISRP